MNEEYGFRQIVPTTALSNPGLNPYLLEEEEKKEAQKKNIKKKHWEC